MAHENRTKREREKKYIMWKKKKKKVSRPSKWKIYVTTERKVCFFVVWCCSLRRTFWPAVDSVLWKKSVLLLLIRGPVTIAFPSRPSSALASIFVSIAAMNVSRNCFAMACAIRCLHLIEPRFITRNRKRNETINYYRWRSQYDTFRGFVLSVFGSPFFGRFRFSYFMAKIDLNRTQ